MITLQDCIIRLLYQVLLFLELLKYKLNSLKFHNVLFSDRPTCHVCFSVLVLRVVEIKLHVPTFSGRWR